jgi:xylulokinase
MYVGLDIGTSGVKAVLVSDAHQVVASRTAPLTVSRPQPGWSEQAPDDWWAATLEAVDGLIAEAREHAGAIRGFGLSGQQHGATLLEASDRPLRPCILWNDTRSAEEAATLEAAADFRNITGNILMPGFTAPKLEWVRRHEPALFDKLTTVLLPKDYIRLRLTGEKLSDMSDSSGTGWLDVARRDWSDPLIAASQLDRGFMPGLIEGTDAGGRLTQDLVERWGLPGRLPVAGGGGDNAASACGIGAVTPGAAFLSLGTSGVLFVSTAGFAPNPESGVHAFCHALPGTWHQMGVILSAVDSLVWLGRITGKSPAELSAAAEAAAAAAASAEAPS